MNFLSETAHDRTLFLDRDGVLNHEKKADYVKHVGEFEWYDGVLEALRILSHQFARIIIVTNQRGIGKGLMTHQDLNEIHQHLKQEAECAGGRIDAFYYAPELESDAINRKPNTGMALQAKMDFPKIDFQKSVMVGNNLSDMHFGKNMGMYTVFLHTTNPAQQADACIDVFYPDLLTFAKNIL